MKVKTTTKNLVNKLPYVRNLYQELLLFKENSCYPAGNYYSPIVSIRDIKKRETEIWGKAEKDGVNGIDLRTEEQIKLLRILAKYYNELPFKAEKQNINRYYFENAFYSYTDGIVLYSMIRYFNPKRIIEIGSGFSSALMLDTNDLFFNSKIELTFIEPFPERLFSQMTASDKLQSSIIQRDVQSVPLSDFEKLQPGDILFIDSSHVVKTDSDVNYILFEILPVLQSGVLIHFHDIFYPFEYPKEWVFRGHNWNEDYFLKAFLMYNQKFEILLFSSYLHMHYKDAFSDMPLCYKNSGGNLWIEKR